MKQPTLNYDEQQRVLQQRPFAGWLYASLHAARKYLNHNKAAADLKRARNRRKRLAQGRMSMKTYKEDRRTPHYHVNEGVIKAAK